MPGTPERISRYPIVRELGVGGMGQIYLARDPDLDRRIALKVLRSDAVGDARAREQLRAEARALAALNHPGIVTVYEVGRDGDFDFIAMEYLDGLSLRDAIESAGEPPTTRTLLAAAAQIARALDAAHSAGVLHRDVKPDNVMIDRSGTVKVVDFGIAHRLRAATAPPVQRTGHTPSPFASTLPLDLKEATMVTNTVFGTPGYMSPEVLVGERATARSDVYSLGVLLYEVLAGGLPYSAATGEELLAVLGRVVDENSHPVPLRQRRPDLPDAVCDVVSHMLAKRPDTRPSMGEVAEALEGGGETDSRPFDPVVQLGAAVASAELTTRAVVAPAAFDSTRQPLGASSRSGRRLRLVAVALAILALGTGGVAAVQYIGAAGTERVLPAMQPRRLVVANLEGRFDGYGNRGPSGEMLAGVMTETLASAGVEVVKLIHDDRVEDAVLAGVRAGADTILALRINHRDGEVTANVELTSADGALLYATLITSDSLAGALYESARVIASALASAGGESFARDVADVAFQLGLVAYADRKFPMAMSLFEQAVTAKPDFPAAWFYLSWCRAWAASPRELTLEAAARAESSAGTDLERRLGAALGLYMDHHYRDAIATLEPLLAKSPSDRDLLYLYAEALFHDGQVNKGIDYFERCMLAAPTFLPARTHVLEVAAARRSLSDIRRLYGSNTKASTRVLAYFEGDDAVARQLEFSSALLDIRAGDYRALDAAHRESTSGKAIAYRLARLLGDDRRDEARRLFRDNRTQLETAGAEPAGAIALQSIGRILLIGELADELRVVRDWWQNNQGPSNLRFRREIQLFSPPVLGEAPAAYPPADLTSREQATQAALALERSGDVAAAARALRVLVDEPAGDYRDSALQHALLRVLRKLDKSDELTTEIRRRCELWCRPLRFDALILVLRHACGAALE